MSTIYVGNLPRDIKERELDDLFWKIGEIEDVQIRSTRNDTIGFVSFRDRRDARDAVDRYDGVKFDGYRLRVEISKRSAQVESSGRRDRGGRDRSRSPAGRKDFKMGDRYFKMTVTIYPKVPLGKT